MREAAAKNRQPPPPPPPRFYSLNKATGSIITNDGSNNSSDNISKNSMNNDLISVLSPNLKSYLDKSTLSTRAAHNDKKQNNHPTVSVVVRTPHHLKERHNDNNNETIEQEEEVYSPHLAALSSPPLQYTHYYQHDDDGLLHSIFSAKKEKKQQKRRSARRRRIGRYNDASKKKINNEEEEDILELFSPGVQEFDLDEAMAANSKGEDTRTYNGALEEGGGGEDEMTLDSVDRIVRGDYLKCHQITNSSSSGAGGGVSVEAATMSFTSPTPTGSKLFAATTTSPPTTAEEVAATTTATTTTTPVMDNTMVKTPTYSTPYNNNNNNNDEDEYEHFYTPVQTNSDNTTDYNWVVQSTTSQVLGGGGGGSLSSLLAPVWEAKEKEELYGEQHDDEKNDKVGDSLSGTPLFQTPKEYKDEYSCSVDRRRGSGGGVRVRWNNNMVEQEEDEDDVREEFFSPLAVQHCDVGARTPNQQQQQQQQQQHVTLENESYNDTIIEEWKKKNSMEVVANEKMGGTNHQQQWQQQNVASPKYSEMREELQQILVEAKKLTPCKEEEEEEEELALATQSSPMSGFIAERASDDKENVQPTTMTSPEATRTDIIHTKNMSPSATPTEHHSLNYSPPNTTPNSHHHHYHHQSQSSSIIIVPPEHLTLDFVKQCDCLDTLKEILSRLSLNNRYPSMSRYVEKRIKIVAPAAASLNKAEDVYELAVVERQHQVVEPVNGSGEVVGNEGVDKENVSPEEEYHDQRYGVSDANIQEGRRSVPPPLETSSLSQSSREERNEVEYSNNEWSMHHRHRQITPENQSIEERSESIMTHETSLDMNLSESLDDESFFWRQDGGDQGDQEKAEPLESQPMKAVEHFDQDERLDARNEQYVGTDTAIAPSVLLEENSTPPESHTELQEKLASSLAAHAQLTERVESLVKEHASIKAELTLKLDQAREQLSQRQSQASAEKEEYTKQVSHLIQVNETLEQEISSLKKRLEVVDKNAVDAASQAELQLDQTRLIQSKLSTENERLGTELDEARQARDRAEAEALRLKEILDERVANADTKDSATKRIRKGLEAAKFANHALANALAISEKDLSEALHQKEKSARECNSLQERIAELEDKSSWLSSKVNEMTKELQSSQKYIDTLYADLQSTRSPSKEMKAELERKELQWLELEHQYTRRIQELERQIASGGSKISMADYVAAVRESRMHQSEALQKQRMVDELESTVSTLKQQIETMRRRPSPRNGNLASMTSRGKSISNLGNYGKKVHNTSSVRIENDENKAPLGDMGGKKIRRTAALKAVGGRKGLSEQLRRARRVGEEV